MLTVSEGADILGADPFGDLYLGIIHAFAPRITQDPRKDPKGHPGPFVIVRHRATIVRQNRGRSEG